MVIKYKNIHPKILYIFFTSLSLAIFFFSTAKVEAKAFDIKNIEISEPFEMSFNKKKVIDKGFKKAFSELFLLITNSSDQKKIDKTKLNEIKSMVDSFSIKEEKFVNEVYYVSLDVSFNRKKIFNFLEKKNIFPSVPLKKNFFFLPIIIDENKKDLLIFSNNKIFDEWNNDIKSFHLLEYILPSEDLEHINLIKSNYEFIEQYDFKDVISKYYLKDSIIALIFKNEKELRVLSRINIKDNVILKNQSFSNTDVDDLKKIKEIISNLKIIYEDYWKSFNQINTSIKLTLNIKVTNRNNIKISNFEKILKEHDLINNFLISKFNSDFIYYQIIFNGTPNNFLEVMKEKNYNFDTQNKIWFLK